MAFLLEGGLYGFKGRNTLVLSGVWPLNDIMI
jgi:hypothetical protein